MNPMTSDTLGVEELIERLRSIADRCSSHPPVMTDAYSDMRKAWEEWHAFATPRAVFTIIDALLPKGVDRGGKEEDGGIKRQSVLVSNDQTEAEPSAAWRPIESYDPDIHDQAALIAGTYPNGVPWVEAGHYIPSLGYWLSHRIAPPTHWMPRPSPPALGASS